MTLNVVDKTVLPVYPFHQATLGCDRSGENQAHSCLTQQCRYLNTTKIDERKLDQLYKTKFKLSWANTHAKVWQLWLEIQAANASPFKCRCLNTKWMKENEKCRTNLTLLENNE